MTEPEIIFKPRYSGRAAFSLYLWPVSAIGFVFFTIDMIRTGAFYTEGLLALMFAMATFSPFFMYFREIRFAEAITVKRYFLPDVVIRYDEIISFQYFSLRTATKRVALSTLHPKSFEELDGIINRLIDKGKIQLKKRR